MCGPKSLGRDGYNFVKHTLNVQVDPATSDLIVYIGSLVLRIPQEYLLTGGTFTVVRTEDAVIAKKKVEEQKEGKEKEGYKVGVDIAKGKDDTVKEVVEKKEEEPKKDPYSLDSLKG